MEEINNYWIDERNNRWNSCHFTEEDAIEHSHSLVDCYNCINCHDSVHCDHCRDLCYSDHCENCQRCIDCHGLRNCHDCQDYLTQPLIYTTGKIGSRNDNTTFYYGDTEYGKSLQVVCGCFHGNLKEFEDAVMKTHAKNDKYRNQYLKEIEKVKVLFELEKEG